jgi:hypothetical protein
MRLFNGTSQPVHTLRYQIQFRTKAKSGVTQLGLGIGGRLGTSVSVQSLGNQTSGFDHMKCEI